MMDAADEFYEEQEALERESPAILNRRDRFAMAALAWIKQPGEVVYFDDIATTAYAIADAMEAERSK